MKFSATLLAPLALLAAAPAQAAPSADALLPAGGQRGQNVEVQIVGKVAEWPVKVWCDRPDITGEALEKKGTLRLQIAADAEPGVCYLRLYDDSGASQPLPFIVGALPERVEKEPNNAIAEAGALDASIVVVNGAVAKRGDVDTFAIDLEAGQTLVAELESRVTLQSPADCVLQILSAKGYVLAQNDDSHSLDPRLAFAAPTTGRYFVRLFAFPAAPNSSVSLYGNAEAVYRLTLTTGPFLDAALPLAVQAGQKTELTLLGANLGDSRRRLTFSAPADAETLVAFLPDAGGRVALPVVSHPSLVEAEPNGPDKPQQVALPASISGALAEPGDEDEFVFDGAKGQTIALRVAGRGLGYPIDPVLEAFNANGKSLGRSDDAGQDRDGRLSLKIPADGRYRARVSDLYGHGGPRFWYRLDAAPVAPDFTLAVGATAYELTADKPLEIAVTIARQAGFDKEIAFEVVGLPDGVTAETPVSKPKGDSAKKIVVKLTSDGKAFSGPIRILGRAASRSKPATAPLGAGQPPLADLWLTIRGS